MSIYTREWNLKWEHLSDSLHNRFYDILGSIRDTDNQISRNIESMVDVTYNLSNFYDLYSKIERELDTKIKELESMIESRIVINPELNETSLGYTIDSSFKGEVLKMGNTSDTIVASPMFYKCKASDNNEDKETMFENAITLTSMFGNWYRFAHYDAKKSYEIDNMNNLRTPNKYTFKDHAILTIDSESIHGRVQNNKSFSTEDIWSVRTNITEGSDTVVYSISDLLLHESELSRDSWVYHKDGEYLECAYKGICTTGIMRPDDSYVGDYYLKVRIDNSNDNGSYGLLLGYLKVEDEEQNIDIEHTLSIVRSNGSNNQIHWALVYDLGYRTQFVLTEDINETVKTADISGNFVIVDARKDGEKLTCNTSIFSNDSDVSINPSYKIEFELPKKKPQGWPVEMYYNLQRMIPRSRAGFVSRANHTKFYILDQQNVLDYDEMLICLNENSVYMNESDTTYTRVGSLEDYLEPRTYLFNKDTNKFFYYAGEDEYQRLS